MNAFDAIREALEKRKAQAKALMENDGTYYEGLTEARAMETFEGYLQKIQTWMNEPIQE